MVGHIAVFGQGLTASYVHELQFLNEQPSQLKCAHTHSHPRVSSGHTQGCDWFHTFKFKLTVRGSHALWNIQDRSAGNCATKTCNIETYLKAWPMKAGGAVTAMR
jgi:hypothetical protein